MRTSTWVAVGAGTVLVGLLVGAGVYEHKAHAAPTKAGAPNPNGGLHLTPIRINPTGGNVVNVALNDGDTVRQISARAGDVVNVTLPVNSTVVSAEYGAAVAWGTGAAQGSTVVSVQVTGADTITVNWTDTDVPARYTTKVQVTA